MAQRQRPRPTVEDFGLLHPVFDGKTVKLPVQYLKNAKLPGICPHCLEPGDMIENFTVTLTTDLGFQRQIQTIRIPISTHRKCSQGFTKKNISGSIKVWGEGGAGFGGIGGNRGLQDLMAALGGGGGRICFTFKDPWYALLFTRVNFPFLLDGSGSSLLAQYDMRLRSYTSGRRFRFPIQCPRCACGIERDTEKCPSCDLDFTGHVSRFQRISVETTDIQNNLDRMVGVARKCPECGIIMFKDPKVKNCARCGASFST